MKTLSLALLAVLVAIPLFIVTTAIVKTLGIVSAIALVISVVLVLITYNITTSPKKLSLSKQSRSEVAIIALYSLLPQIYSVFEKIERFSAVDDIINIFIN